MCCWHQLPSVLSRRAGRSRGRSPRDRPAARQHTRELMSTTHTNPWLIPIITWYVRLFRQKTTSICVFPLQSPIKCCQTAAILFWQAAVPVTGLPPRWHQQFSLPNQIQIQIHRVALLALCWHWDPCAIHVVVNYLWFLVLIAMTTLNIHLNIQQFI